MYYSGSGTCILNSESRSTQPSLFRRDAAGGRQVNYYEKVREETLPILEPTEPEIQVPQAVIPVFPRPRPTVRGDSRPPRPDPPPPVFVGR